MPDASKGQRVGRLVSGLMAGGGRFCRVVAGMGRVCSVLGWWKEE